jgi:hypothetical protein
MDKPSSYVAHRAIIPGWADVTQQREDAYRMTKTHIPGVERAIPFNNPKLAQGKRFIHSFST